MDPIELENSFTFLAVAEENILGYDGGEIAGASRAMVQPVIFTICMLWGETISGR
jgi:hypothetical protein